MYIRTDELTDGRMYVRKLKSHLFLGSEKIQSSLDMIYMFCMFYEVENASRNKLFHKYEFKLS